jgi:pyridoxamine 5'-phosphate oxidase
VKRDISQMRRSYGERGIESTPSSPLELFHLWLAEAAANDYVIEANAMVIATVEDQAPFTRTVLLKSASDDGFTFFTNYHSRKGAALAENPNISATFPWYPLERQVHIQGRAMKISQAESAEYFATRPRGSQIGAWASWQSAPLAAGELAARVAELEAKYPDQVPMPPHWGGYLIVPTRIEFWQGRYSRLHDRVEYLLAPDQSWSWRRLNP